MEDTQPPGLISTSSPGSGNKRAALAVTVFLLAAFAIVAPSAKVVLRPLEVYIPLVAVVMFLTDLMTASLLLTQFSIVRTRALLLLASGYLFTALLVATYGLLWPLVIHPTGLFGAGPQTAPWLYLVWHAGLPTSVIVYGLLKRKETQPVSRDRIGGFILASITSTLLIVLGLSWLVIRFQHLLPALMTSTGQASEFSSFGTGAVFCVSVGAFVLQWRRRQQSVLDLWLSIVLMAWLLGSITLNILGGRYSVGWYATPGFAIVSAIPVLIILLSESLMLHAHLAISVLAQRQEREGRLISMDAMSAAIAHEVGQPLGAIVADADAAVRWLKRTPPNVNEAHDSLTWIVKNAYRAESIIQSVRAIFSSGDGGTAQRRSQVDMNELIRESVDILRGELETAKLVVQLELAKELPLIFADRRQLQQAILNLITNAADAMRAITNRARVLKITSTAIKPNDIVISIEDTGTGIDSKTSDRIFQPFFSTKSNGMGLGLAICQSIVESHGGKVTVGANVPCGSVFRIILPCSPASQHSHG